MTEITIGDVAPEVEYTAVAAIPTGLEVPFAYWESGDVKVRVEDPVGTWTDKVQQVDWSFTSIALPIGQEGGGNPAGNEISFITSITIGSRIRIYRDTGIERLTNLPLSGPLDLAALNDEFLKMVMITQELEAQKENYLYLDRAAVSTEPWDLSSRKTKNLAESDDDTAAATNRQVSAGGPNHVSDDDAETAVGANGAWRTVASGVATIEGNEIANDTDYKKFDLMTEFFTLIQNRGGSEASFRVRYRYMVDCYSEVSKESNQSYTVKVGATSMIPFSFADIVEDLDYTNGNGTVTVYIDLYPMDANSADLYAQWRNLAINTSAP